MSNVLTGNKVNILINGNIIGGGNILQSVGLDTDYGLQDVDGIGTPLTQAHEVGKVVHSITLDKFVISKKNLVNLGYAPDDENLLNSNIIDIEIVNDKGEVEMILKGCSCANHRITITKHAIIGENATFRALRRIIP